MNKQLKKILFALSTIAITTTTHAKTEFNGDVVNGIPVITKLDTADLAPAKRHEFYFQSSQNSLGQHWYVPVIVIKGASDGKKMLLNSSIHGNELNGLQIIHEIIDRLNPTELKGTIVAVPGANPAGMLGATRSIPVRDDNDMQTNLNRFFPGKEHGNVAERHAWLLWNKLYAGNVDYAYDLHSNITNAQFPLFIYADYSKPQIRRIAELIPADIIDTDENGAKGTLETTFVLAGIPAITLEAGQAQQYNSDYINRSVTGIRNMMIDLKMIQGSIGKTAKQNNAFYGNTVYEHLARASGQIEPKLKVGDPVKKGQVVIIQRDPLGKVIMEYKAEADGVIAALTTDVLRTNGNYLFFVSTQRNDSECKKGCWITR
jgi:predicted deacylase